MEDIKCPKCKDTIRMKIRLYGKTKAGKQRYNCAKCSKTFIKDRKKFSGFCPKCNLSNALWRAGKVNGKQRYKCKKCGRRFIAATNRVKRQMSDERIKKIESVIETVLGRRLSIQQAGKDLNIPISTTRNLFLEGVRNKTINPKNISVSARIELSKIRKKNNRVILSGYLKVRGLKCAATRINRSKDEGTKRKLEKLKLLLKFHSDYLDFIME